MLYCVKGELLKLEPRMAVIMCGGVGFRLQITMNTARQMPAIGAEVMLYTEMVVREDAMELFGFADQNELTCFKQLTAISGVGPKVGISILSELTPERVALAVAGGDYKALTKAAGVDFFDVATVVPFGEAPDDIHFTPENHAAVAKAVAAEVKKIFAK